jgi:hypothetical protein
MTLECLVNSYAMLRPLAVVSPLRSAFTSDVNGEG